MQRYVVLVLVILGLIYIFTPPGEKATARKVVLEVMTPHGLVKGEGVFRSVAGKAPWWYPVASRNYGHLFGKAAYVDLGDNRLLLVPLKLGKYDISFSFSKRLGRSKDGFSTVSPPLLFGFSDSRDVNSVQRVDPNDLAAMFGPGYQVVRFAATDTKDPISRETLTTLFPEMHRQLTEQPWFERLKATGAENSPYDDPRRLAWDAFER